MAEQELEILQGTIGAVIFQNYDNGYAVLRLKCPDGQTATVVGTIPLPAVGEGLMVTGRWSSHQNYGRQFEAEFLERVLPQNKPDIIRYLSSRIIKGIGPKTATRIVEHFGVETLQIIERDPMRLAEISGISREKAKAMGQEFRLRVGMRQLMEFLNLHQLPADLAVRCYKRYGEQSMELLYDDPYILMEEGLDASFQAVDQFAVAIGISAIDPRRIEAGILCELRFNLNAGHSFLPEDKLIGASSELLQVEPERVIKAVQRLLEAERLVRSSLAGITVLYLPQLYVAETYTTQRLLEFAGLHFPEPHNLDKMVSTASQDSGLSYSEEQTQAIRSAATSALLLVTGGPGTGKSATRFCVK